MPSVTKIDSQDKFTYNHKGHCFKYSTAGELAILMHSVFKDCYEQNPYEPDTLEYDQYENTLSSLKTVGVVK